MVSILYNNVRFVLFTKDLLSALFLLSPILLWFHGPSSREILHLILDIGGSKEGVPGTGFRVQFRLFSYSFREKFVQIIGWHPNLRSWRPPTLLPPTPHLDPPLLTMYLLTFVNQNEDMRWSFPNSSLLFCPPPRLHRSVKEKVNHRIKLILYGHAVVQCRFSESDHLQFPPTTWTRGINFLF